MRARLVISKCIKQGDLFSTTLFSLTSKYNNDKGNTSAKEESSPIHSMFLKYCYSAKAKMVKPRKKYVKKENWD